MKSIKKSFTDVVIDNTSWLRQYVLHKISNNDIADDLVQEIFIKAFRAYPNYVEEGKLKGWLMRIAQNTLRNYFSLKNDNNLLSLDVEYETNVSMNSYITYGITPEDEFIQYVTSEERLSLDYSFVLNK